MLFIALAGKDGKGERSSSVLLTLDSRWLYGRIADCHLLLDSVGEGASK